MLTAILGFLIRREVLAFLIGVIGSAYVTRKITEEELNRHYKEIQMNCVNALVSKYGLTPDLARKYCSFDDVEFNLYKLATFGVIAGLSGVAMYKALSSIKPIKEVKNG